MFLKLQRKLKANANICVIFVLTCFCYLTASAESCADCNKVHEELAKEQKLIDSYKVLKQKNDDYLSKGDVPEGAKIKVQSNLLLINIKLETGANKIEALNADKKKLGDCANCPPPAAKS